MESGTIKYTQNVQLNSGQILTEDSRRGKRLFYTIKAWDSLAFRGSQTFKAENFPFRLIQVTVCDEKQKRVFKRPMWLVVFGKQRHELSLKACFDNYRDRYDIEHYFRFGKQRLLMDSFQSSETEHDEDWWKLCALSYFQLFLGKEFAAATPETWERYLPEFKNQDIAKLVSASFAQRGFDKVLQSIGTPAQKPVPRGNPLGRKLGQQPEKRLASPINFKKNKATSEGKAISSGKERTEQNPLPQNIDDALKILTKMLDEIGVSMEDFCRAALNSS